MKRKVHITLSFSLLMALSTICKSQTSSAGGEKKIYLVPMCEYQGDTIPDLKLPTVYIFKPLKFRNKREANNYNRMVRDVKRVLPIAKEIRGIIIETYNYLQTLPSESARKRHLKAVEKSIKEQYTPVMKKLTLRQGKLLIKLVDRETNSTGYELVRIFVGPLKAGFYQTFASMFGASLKKEYDPEGDDKMIERIILMVQNGQL